jgi:two-component system cell cycle response regulator
MCEQDGAVCPPYLKQKSFSVDAERMDQPHSGRLRPAIVAAWLGALAVLLAAYAAVILGPIGGSAVQDAFGRWVYDAIVLGAAGAVLIRAAYLPDERLAWLSLGVGLLLWALGQSYYSVVLYYASPAPFPSPSDALFLAFYPATFLALVLLLRSRSARVDSFAWVDGLIGALAVAAVAAALIFPPVLAALGGDPFGVTVSLAYPCADLVLLGLVAGALTTSRWRIHSAWGLIAVALMLFGGADVVYLSVAGQSTEALNLASIGWPLAFLLLAGAAWLPHAAVEPARERSGRSIVPPILLAAAVVCLLAVGNLTPIGVVAVAVGVASLLAVLARLAATFFLNMRMLALTEQEATTDALTDLFNRRSLVADLDQTLAVQDGIDHVLALFDLDGFKAYNDSFGHTAGDELLKRFGANLAAATEPWGKAYRLGGDEFCVLAPIGEAKADVIVKAAEGALSDRGPSFSIRASWGQVELPREAKTAADALRIADRRMYTQKGQRTDSALSQTRGVLLGLLREREPGLDRHLGDVARLAAEMGHALDLEAEDIDVLVRAAEMHDIGKVAVPDEILHKNGPLTDAERELIQKHTLVGERVLAAAPALMQVSKVVRSSHEHWDGSGYPDGLAGAAIPLGSRIILICEAYSAMTEPRPYGPQMKATEALGEIRRSASQQFDPNLVDIFVAKVAPGAAETQADGQTRVST